MRCNGEADGRRERAEGVKCSRVSRKLNGPPKQPSQPQGYSGGPSGRLSINLVGETGGKQGTLLNCWKNFAHTECWKRLDRDRA